MRTLKFEAWDHFNEVMYSSEGKKLSEFFAGLERCIEGGNDISLREFTGLYDKNEKEIYEGDILDLGYAKEDVQYDNKGAGFICGGYCLEAFKKLEVIGNIYQNPDFLKESHG